MVNKKFLTVIAALTIFSAAATACANSRYTSESEAVYETQESSEDNETEVSENVMAEEESSEETEVIDGVEIVNSYDNTAKLMDKFPVINKTELKTDLEKDIANRLLTGFENWNRGFDAWKAWGNILYTDESIYNVHGAKLTLAEYQTSMDMILKQMDLKMGNFNNMLIVDNWAAIYYDITTNGKPGTTMEFVNFQDYGEELGVRVAEGWGGPKDKSYENMAHFQTEEEGAAEKEAWQSVMDYQIPDTDDLEEKYIVKNPTTIEEGDLDIKEMLLEDFEHWNNGAKDWAKWADQLYSDDAVYHRNGSDLSLEELKSQVVDDEQNTLTTKLYFDNMLIRDDWAAIHYRELKEDKASGSKEACDRMEFLHFANVNGELKVVEQWVK